VKCINDLQFLFYVHYMSLKQLNFQLRRQAQFTFEMTQEHSNNTKWICDFSKTMSKGALGHFHTWKKCILLWKHAELGERYLNDIEQLIWESEMRLKLSNEEDSLRWLTENPFSGDAKLPTKIRMVFTELQSSSVYWRKQRTRVLPGLYSSSDTTIWNTKEILLFKFFFLPCLMRTHARYFPPIISKNKSKGWVSLTAELMEVVLKTSTRNIVPQHEK